MAGSSGGLPMSEDSGILSVQWDPLFVTQTWAESRTDGAEAIAAQAAREVNQLCEKTKM